MTHHSWPFEDLSALPGEQEKSLAFRRPIPQLDNFQITTSPAFTKHT